MKQYGAQIDCILDGIDRDSKLRVAVPGILLCS